MKLIPLTQGKFAQVDDEDYDFLMQWKWQAKKHNHIFYAARTIRTKFGRKEIKLHRVILGLIDSKIFADHEDNNGLNCQKNNLRECNRFENSRNKSKKKNKNYLGVHKDSYINKDGIEKLRFRAMIRVNRLLLHIGSFTDEIDAAKAYDISAKEHFGKFANLNFKENE